MAQKPTPQWQPISQLLLIAHHIDGMLKAAQEEYQTLLPAKSKPHVLDNYTVSRVIQVFTDQQNDLWLFDEQLKRWKSGSLTEEQQAEIERLVSQITKLQEQITAILALANERGKAQSRK
jgi:hypothetical protein